MWQVNTRSPSAEHHHALPASTWAKDNGLVLSFYQILFVPKTTQTPHSQQEHLSQHGTGKGDETLMGIHLPPVRTQKFQVSPLPLQGHWQPTGVFWRHCGKLWFNMDHKTYVFFSKNWNSTKTLVILIRLIIEIWHIIILRFELNKCRRK